MHTGVLLNLKLSVLVTTLLPTLHHHTVRVGFTPDADADGFVAYDDLTEADVLVWVHAEVDQDATEAALTANIEAQKNPVTGSGMPW